VARSLDFYRPPVLPDPSLRILDRKGIWAFGGAVLLAAALVVGCLVRIDQLGRDPLGPAEATIVRDWQRPALELPAIERRELLTPVYGASLRVWGVLASSPWMLRFHSVLWALVLIAVVFHLGSRYFSPDVGLLSAFLLALSPPLAAVSQDIGPVAIAAVFLALNLGCLLGAIFRKPTPNLWALFFLTGALAVISHPVAVWVVFVQTIAALIRGPSGEQRGFYGRLILYAILLGAFSAAWFYSTRPPDPSWMPEWGDRSGAGWGSLAKLLGAVVFWGERVYPSSWAWTAASALLVALPLVYGGLAIRHRKSQETNGFLIVCAVGPLVLLLLVPHRFPAVHCPPIELLGLTIGPLAIWAASSLLLGLRGLTRRGLITALLGGGFLLTLWSSRVDVGPAWETYRARLDEQVKRGRPVVLDRVARLADFEEYLGSKLSLEPLATTLEMKPAKEKNLVVLEARSPIYAARERAAAPSPEPLIHTWLAKNCRRTELLGDDFFRISVFTKFDPLALREGVNSKTFYDPAARESLRFIRWFGPFDPGFGRPGATSRVTGDLSQNTLARQLVRSRARWAFEPHLLPGYYHVFVPMRPAAKVAEEECSILWILPGGKRTLQVVGAETQGFSFLWEAIAPNEPLRIELIAPRCGSALAFLGLGIRRYFPYVVDIGAPFDDLALGDGWHEPKRDGDITYRWTKARAEITLYLPAAGGIALQGNLSLRVAQRHPDEQSEVPFEVFWDGQKVSGKKTAAKREWDYVRISLPSAPTPGRHKVLLKSPVFRIPDPNDPALHQRFGIMVDSVAIE